MRTVPAKYYFIIIISVVCIACSGLYISADSAEDAIAVGPYTADLDMGILYGVSYGTSVWQYIENVYSFDTDVVVTDDFGGVINGGDIVSGMQTMIDFDNQQTLNIIVSGDVNQDNIIDEKDIEPIAKHILNPSELSRMDSILFDVNCDKVIDVSDIISLQNVICGIENTTNPIVNSMSMNYSYEKMAEDITALGKAYPHLCDVSIIGKSVFGRDIYSIRIGNAKAPNHILFHGGIHGREHMTCMLIMEQAEYLLSSSQDLFDNREIYSYLQNTCIHFVPMVNPDGVMLSQQGIDSVPDEFADRIPVLIAMSDRGNFATWKANANGIDLNRNFDGSYDGISNQSPGAEKPSFDNYGGDEYFTEPESIALRDYTLSYDFDITISYHSTGEMIFWFYNQSDALLALNYQLACTVGSITGYEVLGSDMPPSTSGYKDWAIEALGIPSLTIETGNETTPLPYNQYESMWQDNKYIPLELIKFNGVYSQ